MGTCVSCLMILSLSSLPTRQEEGVIPPVDVAGCWLEEVPCRTLCTIPDVGWVPLLPAYNTFDPLTDRGLPTAAWLTLSKFGCWGGPLEW